MRSQVFIIGAQRSGSTYLYRVLDSHPDICMAKPEKPEPKFFLEASACLKGVSYYESLYFEGKSQNSIYIGEKSTTYIEFPDAGERIKAFYPDARIIVILRDPVLRAWSNYKFSLDNNIEALDFENALYQESERSTPPGMSTNPYAYRQRGFYSHYLKEYMRIFDRDNIAILISEEFIGNDVSVKDLYRWLGVDSGHTPEEVLSTVNQSQARPELSIEAVDFLVKSYTRELSAIEDLLERPIDVWKDQWKELLKQNR